MNENERDQALEGLLQQAFFLTVEQEVTIERRIAMRIQEDQYAWNAFANVMIGLTSHLHPMTEWLRRPGVRLTVSV